MDDFFPIFMAKSRQTDGRTGGAGGWACGQMESDTYGPTVQDAQVGSKIEGQKNTANMILFLRHVFAELQIDKHYMTSNFQRNRLPNKITCHQFMNR